MIISVPSYVTAGSWLENLRFLADKAAARQVELLFFMYDDETRALVRPEWAGIRQLASRFGYTLHLPDEIADEHEELLELTADFVGGYVVHPPRDPTTLADFAARLTGWQRRYARPFRLENTRAATFMPALAAVTAARAAAGLSGAPPLCLDLGHLQLEGHSPAAWLERYRSSIEEIHLHGCVDGRDHRPFSGQEAWFQATRPFLAGFNGVVELELFDWAQLAPLVALLGEL